MAVQCATEWADASCCPEDLQAAFLWEGDWQSGRTYAANAAVQRGGTTFVCTLGHLSSPANAPDAAVPGAWDDVWDIMAKGGEAINWIDGGWQAATPYDVYDALEHNGSAWIAPFGAAVDEEPGVVDSSIWSLMAAKGDQGEAGANTVVGAGAGDATDVSAAVYDDASTPTAAQIRSISDGADGMITVTADSPTAQNVGLGLRDNTITSAKLLDATIATGKIANDAVDNTKLANMETARIKGRATAAPGDPEDLTGTQTTALLDTFTTSLKGLVPGPTAQQVTDQDLLAADGTWIAGGGGGGGGSQSVMDGRLSISSTLPVVTTDATSTTLFLLPYIGDQMALYNGTDAWSFFTIPAAGLSISVPAAASQMYDVFAYDNAGTPALELTAWTSDTARATALVYQNGVLVKSGATTRRYLGSFRTNASNQAELSFGGLAAGGDPGHIGLWNVQNRVGWQAECCNSTSSFTLLNGIWQPHLNSTNDKIEAVAGLIEGSISSTFAGVVASSGNAQSISVGHNSTTVPGAIQYTGLSASYIGLNVPRIVTPTLGWNALYPIAFGNGAGNVMYGGAQAGVQSGFVAEGLY